MLKQGTLSGFFRPSGTSSSSEGSGSKIPIGWEWVLDIVDEANLATLGMPVSWEKSTETEHARIPINPITGKRIDIYSGKDKAYKVKVGFINSTCASGKQA